MPKANFLKKHELAALFLSSIHNLIQGLLVGLSGQTQLWQVFSVILLHQIIHSLNFGIAMSIGKSSLLSIFGLAFSICIGTAIGTAIGILQSISIPIVKGVAAGAISFYFCQVIHQEKTKLNISGLLKFGSILFGFIVTVLIKILSTGSEMSSESEIVDEITEIPPPLVG